MARPDHLPLSPAGSLRLDNLVIRARVRSLRSPRTYASTVIQVPTDYPVLRFADGGFIGLDLSGELRSQGYT